MVNKDRKYKSWIFLASYAMYMLLHAAGSFYTTQSGAAVGMFFGRMSNFSISWLFGISFIFLVSMHRRKSVSNRAVRFLMAGLLLWLTWGSLITVGGFTLFASSMKNLIILMAFTAMLFMGARIAEAYDLEKDLVGITAFILGTTLLGAYIVHFNGLEFLDAISNVLSKHNRYRNSFGVAHPNHLGAHCLNFFMFTALYGALLEQKQHKHITVGMGGKNDALYTYLLCLIPVVIIMLISCASRTCISATAGFWLVYLFMRRWYKVRGTTKVMIFTAIFFVIVFSAALLDWGRIWSDFVDYSYRAESYTTSLPLLTARRVWLTGFGFGYMDSLNRLRDVVVIDSFYLNTLLQSGLVGFVIQIGTILYFSFVYFMDNKRMTKVQSLIGGMLAVMLWYGLFERSLYDITAISMVKWILLIIASDERHSNTLSPA